MSEASENTFEIREQNLSAVSCDTVLGDLSDFLAAHSKGGTVLDLTQLGFVDPYGMALLCLVGRLMGTHCEHVSCRLPEDSAIESYLTRMRVFEDLTKHVTLDRTPHTDRAPARNDSLLEVLEISQQGDVEAALALIESRVSSILTDELGYAVREITDFKQVVAELCHNILDHSGDRGLLVAQRYVNHKLNQKFAIIGVCDLGMGVRTSLGSRFDTAGWSHGEAILRASQKEVSREASRGLGLYIVNRICQDYRGSLHIRSGDARVYFRGKRTRVLESGPFPGTQVSITLYEKA